MFLAAIWMLGCWIPTTSAQPWGHTASPAIESRLWLISTREAPSSLPPRTDVAALRYWYFQEGLGWSETTLAEFTLSSDPRQITVFWIHGNRIDVDDVMPQAVALLKRLDQMAEPGTSFRLVAWSWPSGRIPGPLTDVRTKARRSECQSIYLAEVAARLPGNVPVSMIGFSYGARLMSGALHLLGGGSLDGVVLQVPQVDPMVPLRRAIMLAAALDDDWLLPGRRNGNALLAVNQMIVIANPLDPVLRLYPWLYPGRDNRQALGAVGLASPWQLPDRDRIYQIDASAALGRVHSFQYVLGSDQILARITPFALFENGVSVAARLAPPRGSLSLVDQSRRD